MSEDSISKLLAVLPEGETPLSNKKAQELLGWTREEYERVRDLAVTAKVIRKGPGQGGSIRRAAADARVEQGGAVGGGAESSSTTEADNTGGPEPRNAKEEFALLLQHDLEARRDARGITLEQALADHVIALLGEEGTFGDPVAYSYADVDSFSGDLRLRFDGYDLHEDNDEDRDVVDLFVAHVVTPIQAVDGVESIAIPVVDGVTVNALFRAARRFVEEAQRDLHKELTDDPEARDVARSIRASKNLARVYLNLITNAEVRQFDRSTESVGGVEVFKRVMDLNHLRRLSTPDDIEVDFSEARQGGIPCVALPDSNGVYRSYLAVVPGAFLCKLYERYQQRLLEANVRSYLKASNRSVNHGILTTIRNSPEMFFAFNNGITAVADELIVEASSDGGHKLVRCRNLQVVNGGQTTASLYHASLRKVPLDRVFVPMKINEVIDRSRADAVVQNISVSANSQNKVNLSDLGANQKFHVELQNLAKTEVPPTPAPNIPKGARWYYERMRGQYQNDLTLARTKAKKRDYQLVYPKSQVITKTDVARYFMIWDQRPNLVSYGSEKNYQSFRKHVADNFVPDAAWFHALIAKAIITEHCDEIVTKSKVPGYKANIVAYTVALLSKVRGAQVDLEKVWAEQRVDAETDAWLAGAIDFVRAHITKPAAEGRNVGEWCKREDCWKTLVTDWNARTP